MVNSLNFEKDEIAIKGRIHETARPAPTRAPEKPWQMQSSCHGGTYGVANGRRPRKCVRTRHIVALSHSPCVVPETIYSRCGLPVLVLMGCVRV